MTANIHYENKNFNLKLLLPPPKDSKIQEEEIKSTLPNSHHTKSSAATDSTPLLQRCTDPPLRIPNA